MPTMPWKFIREDEGADLIEYALIVGLLAFAVVLAMDGLNTSITGFFTNVGTKLGELARQFPVSRPAISQHLRVLKKAHLVVDTPVGNRRLYAVDPAGVDALRAYFDRFWAQALDAFKKMAEQTSVKEER